MLATLADPILPVFMVMAAGYLLRRIGVMEAEHAGIINRYAFYLAVPALIVSVVATTPFLQIEWRAVAVYSSLQVGLALAGFAVLRLLFRIEMREAVLLGMATSFVNHVFFVLPIAERLVGPDAAMPMAGIVMVDAGFIFPMSVLLVARLSGGRSGQGRLAGLPLASAPATLADRSARGSSASGEAPEAADPLAWRNSSRLSSPVSTSRSASPASHFS